VLCMTPQRCLEIMSIVVDSDTNVQDIYGLFSGFAAGSG
jgi:hypothetical protein